MSEREEDDIDARLDRLTSAILIRMEEELDNYTVPQLLTGLHKCLQVRVLLLTLRQRSQETANVGSAVRKYAAAFSPHDAGRGKRGARRRIPASTDIPTELLTDPDDDE